MPQILSKSNIGYKSVIDLGRETQVPFPHNLYDYPTKILPQVMGEFIERLSEVGEVVLDPFAGSGTVAVECALRHRASINVDVNPRAIEIAQQKLALLRSGTLFEPPPPIDKQIFLQSDARQLPLPSESVDAVVTDIPYADMIKYSELPNDLSNIPNYDEFLIELSKALDEILRVLKKGRYCAIFVADYRIGRSRIILPLHADVIYLMQERGFELFDLYVWRYYRSGSFRPFGTKPYQAMNTHSYVLVFHKPVALRNLVKNRPVRYRSRLIEKLRQNAGNSSLESCSSSSR